MARTPAPPSTSSPSAAPTRSTAVPSRSSATTTSTRTNYIARNKTQLIFNDFGFFCRRPDHQGSSSSSSSVKSGSVFVSRPRRHLHSAHNGDAQRRLLRSLQLVRRKLQLAGSSNPINCTFPEPRPRFRTTTLRLCITTDGRAIANVYKTMSGLGLSFRDGWTSEQQSHSRPSQSAGLPSGPHPASITSSTRDTASTAAGFTTRTPSPIPIGTFSNAGNPEHHPDIRNRPGQSYCSPIHGPSAPHSSTRLRQTPVGRRSASRRPATTGSVRPSASSSPRSTRTLELIPMAFPR